MEPGAAIADSLIAAYDALAMVAECDCGCEKDETGDQHCHKCCEATCIAARALSEGWRKE